jgi:hypothetical protein
MADSGDEYVYDEPLDDDADPCDETILEKEVTVSPEAAANLPPRTFWLP